MEQPPIIIDHSFTGINKKPLSDYLAHAYCHEGNCTFTYNNNEYRFQAGDCLITRYGSRMSDFRASEDFRMDIIYVTPEFIEICTPQSNYGMRGQLALFNNPIMRLTEEQQKVCKLDFDYVRQRLELQGKHHFHRDAMINAIQCMIIDFFDFHVELFGNEHVSTQYAQLMERFFDMLERGDFRKERELKYYADQLCVTTKYLSEVSKKVSGFAANYWIMRFTTLDISRQLRDKSKTLTELTALYGFSSLSYFSRYVQKYLGVSPSSFRE